MKRQRARVGDVIEFERKRRIIEGTVKKIRENTVVVRIPEKDRYELGYLTDLTVVNHSRYRVKHRSVQPEQHGLVAQ